MREKITQAATKKLTLLIPLLLLALALAGCSGRAPNAGQAAAWETRRPAPQFVAERVGGGKLGLHDLRGKAVLLDFWATWCQPCIEEIPQWNSLQRKYAGPRFTVVGMTVQSGWLADVEPYVGKFGIQYPVLVGTEDLARAYQVWGFPTTYLLDAEGRIVAKYVGQSAEKFAKVESDIRRLLGETL